MPVLLGNTGKKDVAYYVKDNLKHEFKVSTSNLELKNKNDKVISKFKPGSSTLSAIKDVSDYFLKQYEKENKKSKSAKYVYDLDLAQEVIPSHTKFLINLLSQKYKNMNIGKVKL